MKFTRRGSIAAATVLLASALAVTASTSENGSSAGQSTNGGASAGQNGGDEYKNGLPKADATASQGSTVDGPGDLHFNVGTASRSRVCVVSTDSWKVLAGNKLSLTAYANPAGTLFPDGGTVVDSATITEGNKKEVCVTARNSNIHHALVEDLYDAQRDFKRAVITVR